MFNPIFNIDDSFFLKTKLAPSWRAPQENDAKFRFAIHPKGIRQFHDHCQIAKCQTLVSGSGGSFTNIIADCYHIGFFCHFTFTLNALLISLWMHFSNLHVH